MVLLNIQMTEKLTERLDSSLVNIGRDKYLITRVFGWEGA